jgi:hypothetical protein
MGKFTGFRQEILLKIVGIVEAAGTRFAAPTRLTYQAKDPGFETDKAGELPAGNAFHFPGKVQTATT